MRQRCVNPRHKSFKDYGARGISVCAEWRKFKGFLADMGQRPTPRHTLERKDRRGNYEPGNCEWANWITQANNRSSNSFLEFNGKCQTKSMWARELGISRGLITDRLDLGWSVEKTLTRPKYRLGERREKILTFNGKSQNMRQWANDLGIHPVTLLYRFSKSHWPLEKALTTPGRSASGLR